MSLIDIHSCSKVFAENTELKLKIHWLLNRKKELERQLMDLKETMHSTHIVPKHTSKHVAVQTDFKSWVFWQSSEAKRKEPKEALKESDILKMNKVVEMHSQLLKRYDKEVKMNMSYADTISDLNVRLSDSEQRIRTQKEKIMTLERDLLLWKAKRRGGNYEKFCEGDSVLREVVTEKNKLASENAYLKRELKGLDANFFDEVEDIKFAFVQSAKLNKQYGKILEKLCKQYGIPCPTPDMVLKNS